MLENNLWWQLPPVGSATQHYGCSLLFVAPTSNLNFFGTFFNNQEHHRNIEVDWHLISVSSMTQLLVVLQLFLDYIDLERDKLLAVAREILAY